MTKTRKKMDVHFSSASSEWQTPRWLFDQLNAEFAFDLDAAATAANALCPRFYTAEIDALKQDWSEGGAVKAAYCNPPYGKIGPQFIRYAYEQTRLHPELTVVMLVPARPDTKVWYECCAGGEVRFLKGRLTFFSAAGPIRVPTESVLEKRHAPNNAAPFPSAIVVFGARARARTTRYVSYKEPKVIPIATLAIECISQTEGVAS